MSEFYSVRRLPPYVFEQVNRLKASARAAGADIIDLGMGNPDLPTPTHIVEKLAETARREDTHGYSASRGINGLRKAQAAYYDRRFGVKLDPNSQVIVTIGSKEGFANMAHAITAPGDVVLCPNPSYPIHAFGFLMAGGVIRSLPATPDAGLFPRARAGGDAFDAEAAGGRRLLSVEPDGPSRRPRFLPRPRQLRAPERADRPFRSRLCRGLFRRQPAALDPAGAGRDGRRGRVHLDVEDLLDGRLARRLRRRQRAPDRGARPGEVLSRLRRVHADPGGGGRRAERPAGVHRRDARRPTSAGATRWSTVSAGPAGRSRRRRLRCSPGRRSRRSSAALGSLEFSKLLIEKADVAVAPGIGFGEHGDGYVRIALVENEQRIRQAARNLRRFLDSADKTLHNVVSMTTTARRPQRPPLPRPTAARSGPEIPQARSRPWMAGRPRWRRPDERAASPRRRRARQCRLVAGPADRAPRQRPRRAHRPADRDRRRLGARPARRTAASISRRSSGSTIRWRSPAIPATTSSSS